MTVMNAPADAAVGRRTAGPVYRVLLRDSNDVLHTCVVAGPSHTMVWLYVHAPSPTVLRLHRDLVGWLLPIVAELLDPGSGSGPWYWSCKSGPGYPACVVAGQGRDLWLQLFAQNATAVRLTRPILVFLRDVLADLPTSTSAESAAVLAGD